MTVRVVFADDNYLVREGVAALLTETAEIDLVETVADPDALHRRGGAAPAGRRAHRHPDAADVHHRGHRRGEADPGRVPGDGGGGALAVRRGGLRVRACSPTAWRGSATCSRSGSRQVDELVRALHEVARGGSALDPKVVEGLLARKTRRPARPCSG